MDSDEAARPNRGTIVPDVVAKSDNQESQEAWIKRQDVKPEDQIRLTKLVHMRYQHPDLSEITRFLQDFGMHVAKKTEREAWYRGYSSDQYVYYARKGSKAFLGGTFEVESYEELVKASKLPSAGPIQELTDAPGGGHMLTLTDPEGFPVNLIYGQTPAETGTLPERLVFNYETDKPRVRSFLRFEKGPAAVHKLGHYGLCVQQFDAILKFYTSHFNMVPSDFLYVDGADGQRRIVAMFAHIDRGEEYVDHHSFFVSANPTSHVHHSSFEVHDFDTQNLGHHWLAEKKYRPVWGVGRHILGSQIFDYWWDTTGFMIEHYADGDIVNKHTPIGYGPAGHESLAVWGPEVPSWFLD